MRKLLFFLLLTLSLQALELTDNGKTLVPEAQALLALFDVPEMPLDDLVPYLKDRWSQEDRERWEMEERMEEMRDIALPYLKKLSCIETIHAKEMHYRYALVLGADGKTMKQRLDFLYQEWQRGVCFDQIVLLTGDRDLDPKIETFKEGMKNETDLFVGLFQHHPLYHVVPHVVIDAPKEGSRRPNTGSTVQHWLLTSPEPGNCLALSTQPFVGYQEACVRFHLPPEFTVEAIGPASENVDAPPFPLAIYLDNFAKWLYFEIKTWNQ